MARNWTAGMVAAGLLAAAGFADSAYMRDRALMRVAATGLDGPVSAQVTEVIDGDTMEVQARIWLGQSVTVRVRLDGIDTPELHSACAEERRSAEAVRAWLEKRLLGAEVQLRDIRYDKYGGRVLASLVDRDGDVGRALIAAGLARRYDGGARQPWCAES